jgi:hypothetical protein
LVLEIRGMERTGWIQELKAKVEEKKQLAGTPSNAKVSRNVFLDAFQLIQNFPVNVMVAPGFYTFPFSFQLPAWVPSSLFFNGDKKNRASILYTLKARVEDNTLNKSVRLPSIMGKRRFIVVNQNCQRLDNITLESGQTIKAMGIVNEGTASVRAIIDRNYFN